MIDGYLMDPDQARQNSFDRRDLILSVATWIALKVVIEVFQGRIVTMFALTMSGFWWFSHVAPFAAMMAVVLVLRRRRVRGGKVASEGDK